MKKLFIIDGNSLLNRAFYALPFMANSDGVYSNAVFGFINCVIRLFTENKPDYMVVAFDHTRKTFRNTIFEAYKGTRKETPEELRSQFALIREALTALNIHYIEQEGIEADDIIGTITKISGLDNTVITGDRDSLQLINKTTKVWLTVKGITNITEVNEANITELFGLNPSQIIDYKALAGDSSDNIPGVQGIGEKTAIGLIQEFGSVKGIYENIDSVPVRAKNKLIDGKEMCDLSYTLATIKTDCDINFDLEKCKYEFPFGKNAKDFFKKYSFNAFLKRDIFKEEIMVNNEAKIIKNREELNAVLNSFSGNYFALDLRDKLLFGFNGNAYKIESEITLFDINPISIAEIKEKILPILNNPNILKIVCDLKAHMHLLNINNIENAYDIKLADYLLLGGNKNEQETNIAEYYVRHLEQQTELKQKELENLYYNIELPLINVLYNMEISGFKIDREQLILLSKEYSEELKYIEGEVLKYTTNQNLNIKSSKQLAEFLFGELALSDKGNKKHSTNVEVLNELVGTHPVIELILRYRKVQKLHSTYIEPYIKLTEKQNIINTIFNQMLTATGRLSSSEPNLQNIPVRSEEGKNLRKLFISSFSDGSIISADYNQIELRLMANFSEDENLVADYNKGADIHRFTASQIFDKAPNQVTDAERRMAKAVNFGIIYGISSFGLSKNISVSVKEAQSYINKYFDKYPKVKEYLDAQISFAKQNGYVKTEYNRIRYIPELSASNMIQRTFGERVAMNMPLQGSASDIIKIAMIKVFNRLKSENLRSKLILQIHDELIVDTHPNEKEIVKQILLEEMQSVYLHKVPLLVEVGEGKTWFDCK